MVDDLEEMPVPEIDTHPPTGAAAGEEIDEDLSGPPGEDIDEDL